MTPSRLGYNAHYVVDGGKARVILSALVVPADVKDNLPMLDLLWRSCFRWRLRPHHVTGDSIYGSLLENIRAMEDAGIRAFVPARDWTHNAPGSFSKKDFRYEEGRNLYICPAGEELHHIGNSYTERVSKYRADAAICNCCALKAKCTRANSGRLLRRSFDEHYIERVRLPRDRGLQEGHAEEAGMDRAALRRSQAMARHGEDEAQDAGACELRGPAHRLRTERKAAAQVRGT